MMRDAVVIRDVEVMRHAARIRAAVFLDRDGVINRAVVRERHAGAPRCLAELELLPGVRAALRALKGAGYRLVVVTNQPDVARGTARRANVEAINQRLCSTLPLDAVFMCSHDDRDRCLCRKPKPGLLARAARELHIDCTASYMVGDRWHDIEAGRRAGCRTLLVDHGYTEPQPAVAARAEADFRVGSLLEAARIILGREVTT